LEADYSPDNIFFRQFHLWNQHADLAAFVTLAKDYFQVQELRFDLNGHPRLQGNVFVPFSVARIRQSSRWLDTMSADPFFDVAVTMEPTDLAELSAALKTKPDMTGWVNSQIQLSGTPASLQGKIEFHLKDFVLDGSSAMTADAEMRLELGMANFKALAVARGSDPAKIEGVLPVQLAKRDVGYAFVGDGPLSVTLNFPAIILGKLPRYLSRGIFTRGILSGNLTIADSIQEPLVTGSVNLVDCQLLRGTTVSAGVTFKGRNAMIDFIHLSEPVPPVSLHGTTPSLDVSGRGDVDFANLTNVSLKISPSITILASSPELGAGDCVSSIEFYAAGVGHTLPSRPIPEIGLVGNVRTGTFRISFPSANGVDLPDVFPLCHDTTSAGKTLLLIAPSLSP
jgi:hypothetical protein